jgi:glycerate-2-kinase
LCLLSGGGSALLVSPEQDITLRDKQLATDLLLRSGANIDELNAVRKHLSAVKGGRLARIAQPATLISLLVSDVIGDKLDVIASGPTVPDSTTFPDAWAVIEKYQLRDALPERVRRRLQRGIAGQEQETPKDGDPCFRNVTTMIVAGLGQALSAAREYAERLELRTRIITQELRGEARDAALFLADEAVRMQRELPEGEKGCLLSGGETVVSVMGSGKGGRNQELALAFALKIAGQKGITLLSAGTDGTDGPTNAAGAVVDGHMVVRARERGLDPQSYLVNHDSYTFFEQYDIFTGEHCHFKTGPTGTNVMDVQLILLEGQKIS